MGKFIKEWPSSKVEEEVTKETNARKEALTVIKNLVGRVKRAWNKDSSGVSADARTKIDNSFDILDELANEADKSSAKGAEIKNLINQDPKLIENFKKVGEQYKAIDPNMSGQELHKKLQEIEQLNGTINDSHPFVNKIKEFFAYIVALFKDPSNQKKKKQASATADTIEAMGREQENIQRSEVRHADAIGHPQSEVNRPATLDIPPTKVIAERVGTPINNNPGAEIPPTNTTPLSNNNRILTPAEEKEHSWTKVGEVPISQVKDPDHQTPPLPTPPPEIPPPVSPPTPPVSPPVYSQNMVGPDLLLGTKQADAMLSSLEAPASIIDTLEETTYYRSEVVPIPPIAPLKAEPVVVVGQTNNLPIPPPPPPLSSIMEEEVKTPDKHINEDLLAAIRDKPQLKPAEERILSELPKNLSTQLEGALSNNVMKQLAEVLKERGGQSEGKSAQPSRAAAVAFLKDKELWAESEKTDQARQDEADKRNAGIDKREAEEKARKIIEEANKKAESVTLNTNGKPPTAPPLPSGGLLVKKPSSHSVIEGKGKAQPSQNGLHLDKAAQAKIEQLYSGVTAELHKRFNKQASHLPQDQKLPRNHKKEEHAR